MILIACPSGRSFDGRTEDPNARRPRCIKGILIWHAFGNLFTWFVRISSKQCSLAYFGSVPTFLPSFNQRPKTTTLQAQRILFLFARWTTRSMNRKSFSKPNNRKQGICVRFSLIFLHGQQTLVAGCREQRKGNGMTRPTKWTQPRPSLIAQRKWLSNGTNEQRPPEFNFHDGESAGWLLVPFNISHGTATTAVRHYNTYIK